MLDRATSSPGRGVTILDSESTARRIADLALERKALDVVVIDVQGRTSYTDFIVLASGTSDRHVQAVAEYVADTMKNDDGVTPLGREGLREGQWALVDFGSVVCHVFHQFTRDLYDLEELWKDAPRVAVDPPASAGTGR